MTRCRNNKLCDCLTKPTVVQIDLKCKISLIFFCFITLVYIITTLTINSEVPLEVDIKAIKKQIIFGNYTCSENSLPVTLDRIADLSLAFINYYTKQNEGDPWIASSYNSSQYGDFMPKIKTNKLAISGLSKMYKVGRVCLANAPNNRIKLTINICVDEIDFINEGILTVGFMSIQIKGSVKYLIMKLEISVSNEGTGHPELDYFEILSMNQVFVETMSGLGALNSMAKYAMNSYTRDNRANITERIANVIKNNVVERNLRKVEVPYMPCRLRVEDLFPNEKYDRTLRKDVMAVKNHVC